jgi:hypothetical protein
VLDLLGPGASDDDALPTASAAAVRGRRHRTQGDLGPDRVGPVLAPATGWPASTASRSRRAARRPASCTSGCPPTEPAAVAAVVQALRARRRPFDGTVTVLTAPQAVRALVDLWGPVPGWT